MSHMALQTTIVLFVPCLERGSHSFFLESTMQQIFYPHKVGSEAEGGKVQLMTTVMVCWQDPRDQLLPSSQLNKCKLECGAT